MIRLSNIFIENITTIKSVNNKFNIEFDTIKNLNISASFLDLTFFYSLNGDLYNKNNGLIIKYFDEKNKLLYKSDISKFTKILKETKTQINNYNEIKCNNTVCKFITKIIIYYTYNNNEIELFSSESPKHNIFCEKINNTYGIALPFNIYETMSLINNFNIYYN